jgi:O-antigen/teichoic acid export membrane protein
VLGAATLSAVAMYALVATASRVLDDEGFALLNVWLGVLTFAVVVAFSPVEALAPRIVGFGDSHGLPREDSRRDVTSLAAVALGVAVIVGACSAYPLAATLFDGNVRILLVMLPALGVYGAQSVQKGLAVAELRTGWLLIMQGAFAVLLICGLVAIIATPALHFSAYFMALLIIAVGIAVVITWRLGAPLARVRYPLATNVAAFHDGGSLMVSAAATQAMTIAPVPVFAYLAPTDTIGIGILAGTLLICRVPVMLMAPVNALLISRMTGDAVRGARSEVTRLTLVAASVVGALGVVSAVLLLAVGSLLLRILIGDQYPATPLLFFWQMFVVGLMCSASVVRLGVLTLGYSGRQLPIWIASLVGFACGLALPLEPMNRVVAAQLISSSVAVAGLVALLWWAHRHPEPSA